MTVSVPWPQFVLSILFISAGVLIMRRAYRRSRQVGYSGSEEQSAARRMFVVGILMFLGGVLIGFISGLMLLMDFKVHQ